MERVNGMSYGRTRPPFLYSNEEVLYSTLLPFDPYWVCIIIDGPRCRVPSYSLTLEVGDTDRVVFFVSDFCLPAPDQYDTIFVILEN